MCLLSLALTLSSTAACYGSLCIAALLQLPAYSSLIKVCRGLYVPSFISPTQWGSSKLKMTAGALKSMNCLCPINHITAGLFFWEGILWSRTYHSGRVVMGGVIVCIAYQLA